MTPLITALMLWLCANFDLPSTQDLPRIEFVPHSKIVELRYHGLTRPQSSDAMTPDTDAREPVAMYMNTSKTIYLREGWSGSTPAELSVLVHELVHHLQNVG